MIHRSALHNPTGLAEALARHPSGSPLYIEGLGTLSGDRTRLVLTADAAAEHASASWRGIVADLRHLSHALSAPIAIHAPSRLTVGHHGPAAGVLVGRVSP
jgi:hypothetical protein